MESVRWRRLSWLYVVAAVGLLALPAGADPDTSQNEPPPLAAPASEGETGGGGAGASPSTGGAGGSTPVVRRQPEKKRRGGINPCMTPDPGFGAYDRWVNVSTGQMLAPKKGGITKKGSFDLLIHFHGHEPVRKEFVKVPSGIVLVGVDLGIGSGAYQSAFASPSTFTQLLSSVEAAMSKKTGKDAHVRKIALSSWSAGYGAIEQILRQPAGRKVDALVLLDSVHAGYADEQKKTLKEVQVEPFVDFARRAAKRDKLMFLSHSSIIPPGYASTTETAAYIVDRLRGKQKRASRADVLGLDMLSRFDRGHLHVRGYSGDDKPDHCAHIGLLKDVVRVHLAKRWKTPKAR